MTDTTIDPPSGPAPKPQKRLVSAISGLPVKRREVVALGELRPSLADRIRQDYPELHDDSPISESEVARYRALYVEELLQQEHGEFTELDRQVTESIARQDTIAENVEDEFDDTRTLGERLSDHLATFGGSWGFISIFGVVLFGWMALNLVIGDSKAFDPYPFILLNLVLSCLAAIQAPIIMMSQKRQEAKDRLRALNDYRVNLKAELEIRHLHEKIDYLIARQWQRHAEIQQLQLDMLAGRRKKRKYKLRTPKNEPDSLDDQLLDDAADDGEDDGPIDSANSAHGVTLE